MIRAAIAVRAPDCGASRSVCGVGRASIGLGAVGAAIALFAAVTWVALESGEVVVLRTRTEQGGMRETRVWIDDSEGALWLEAASPESPWYREAIANPEIEILRADGVVRVRTIPQPGPAGHARIRAMFRAKYGWRDVWVGLVQDVSRSVLVRAEPLADTPSSESE